MSVANVVSLTAIETSGHNHRPTKSPIPTQEHPARKVLVLFGTRPELIKLAPVIHQLDSAGPPFRAVSVSTGQHKDLLPSLIDLFGIQVDYDLRVMRQGQTPNQVFARTLAALDPVFHREKPDLVVIQGDTTAALAGAWSAFHQRIPIGHVEAGLRSGNANSPFPEEMNRRTITGLATYHFAATPTNRATLLAEGVASENIFITGNPVVDALQLIQRRIASPGLERLLQETKGLRRLVLTSHRNESFGPKLAGYFQTLREFVDRHDDVVVIFPVHPNPAVRNQAAAILSGHARIRLTDPLAYVDFISLLKNAWLIVSDSGGIQEEAPALKKPLLVLRENTERLEAITCGVARLAGPQPQRLQSLLEEAYSNEEWTRTAAASVNPFGAGDSGRRIVQAIDQVLATVDQRRSVK